MPERPNIDQDPETDSTADSVAGSTGGSETDAQSTEPESIATIARRLGPASILAAVWVTLPAIAGFTLLARLGPVSKWLNTHEGLQGVGIYTGGFIVLAGIGLLPTYSMALLGGWAFGVGVGTAAALAGFVGASAIGYAIAKPTARRRVEAELGRHKKWKRVRDAMLRSGPLKTLGIVTLVRVPPNSPFAMTNLVLASTGVPMWSYLLGTAAGMLPRTALAVWIASNIGDAFTKDTAKAARPGWYLPVSIGVSVVMFVILYQIGKRSLERITREEDVE